MSEQRKHLKRLSRVWVDNPVYFVTCCVKKRRSLLANDTVHTILAAEWKRALDQHGWAIGSYIIMPEHAHFFGRPTYDAKTLSQFMEKWKEWTSKKITRHLGIRAPLWQKGFFDHVIRSDESYSEKWAYVERNPVRADLANEPEDWQYRGHIHFK